VRNIATALTIVAVVVPSALSARDATNVILFKISRWLNF